MDQVINIPARFPISSELGVSGNGLDKEDLARGRLLFDPGTGDWVFGRSSFFSTRVKQSRKYVWGNVAGSDCVELLEDGGFLNRRYAVSIRLREPLKICDSLRAFLVFWTSKRSALCFIDAAKRYLQEKAEREARATAWSLRQREFLDEIARSFGSRGRVTFASFAQSHRDMIHGLFGSSISADEESHQVKKAVEQLIMDQRLRGVIDDERGEYVDRDLLVKEEKVVNVNIDMDFNSLLEQLGNCGVKVSSLQCPRCSAPLNSPSAGTSRLRCSSCGSVVEITDLFEKLNALISKTGMHET